MPWEVHAAVQAVELPASLPSTDTAIAQATRADLCGGNRTVLGLCHCGNPGIEGHVRAEPQQLPSQRHDFRADTARF